MVQGGAVWQRIQRWAWILLFIAGLGGAVFSLYFVFVGPTDIQTQDLVGQDWDEWSRQQPEAADLAELGFGLAGVNGFVAGVLGMAIAAGPYRRGERWAWFAMLSFLVLLVGAQFVNAKTGLGIDADAPFLLLVMALGLLLPLPRFFGHNGDRGREQRVEAGRRTG